MNGTGISTKDLSGSKHGSRLNKRDNRLNIINSLNTFQVLTIIQADFMLSYRLQFASFRDLLLIIGNWLNGGKYTTSCNIQSIGSVSGHSVQAINQRLRSLVKKGLIEMIGCSKGNGKMFIPTVKTIKELSDLIKQ